jgi:riboflavin kinase/FMN adenylyltransferase
MLQEYSEKYGFKVEVFEKKKYEGREISSTYIKEELSKGNVELVNRLLGYNLIK